MKISVEHLEQNCQNYDLRKWGFVGVNYGCDVKS